MRSKPRLLLLSDIWGNANADWIQYYLRKLSDDFDVHYYDVCELAGVDTTNYTAENLHARFVNGGIEKAVTRLIQIEKKSAIVLGFSIGGLIAWKAALTGLSISHLFAISSTRLRYETQKPSAQITLFYGSLDPFCPDESWMEQMGIKAISFEEETHEFYKKQEIAQLICAEILLKHSIVR